MKDEDEGESPVSYRLALALDEDGNEGIEIAVFDASKKIDPESLCDELEYFIQNARENKFKVFEQLYNTGDQLH